MSGRLLLAAALLTTVAACTTAQADQPAPAPAIAAQSPAGIDISALGRPYLPRGSAPNSLLLNPPPPAPGSSAMARDEEVQQRALALQGTPRWELAMRDAQLSATTAHAAFSCAAGLAISPETTPKTVALLRRTAGDVAFSTYPTKTKYMRQRPFMVNHKPQCTPDHEGYLRRDGSYPSGHSPIGFAWGLILAELVPARSAELVARGRAFGDSRVVCNVHWLSDVEEGRLVGTAMVARLHAEPAFRADLDAARAERAAIPPNPAQPQCAEEAAALALSPLNPPARN